MRKSKRIVIEVINSGIISVLGGSFILLTDPGFYWGLIGTGCLIAGVLVGYDYTTKTTQKTSDKRREDTQ